MSSITGRLIIATYGLTGFAAIGFMSFIRYIVTTYPLFTVYCSFTGFATIKESLIQSS